MFITFLTSHLHLPHRYLYQFYIMFISFVLLITFVWITWRWRMEVMTWEMCELVVELLAEGGDIQDEGVYECVHGGMEVVEKASLLRQAKEIPS